ncbi:MAG: GNAT family N-acetyltransferase [Prevotellaceae bacterium]|nr:GNAT family N-acetyltransferase [Prevotellaceae bacterium]
MNVKIIRADASHVPYAQRVCDLIYESAQQRGTGIAKRTPEYVGDKMADGKAVVALDGHRLVGFSYIETWGHGKFVANSGLIVDPLYRNMGLAYKIKKKVFELSRELYPDACIFGITTGLAVMKINSALGYVPVTFSELTDDPVFWKGCEGCRNYDILTRNNYRMCLCTGMLYDPRKHQGWFAKALDKAVEFLPRAQRLRLQWWMRRRWAKRKIQRQNRAKARAEKK